MSESEHASDSPLSEFSLENDEIVWTHGPLSSTDFIVLRHPLLDARSLSSTLSDLTGHPGSDGDPSSALERLSLCNDNSTVNSTSTSAQSDSDRVPSENRINTSDSRSGGTCSKAERRARSPNSTSANSEFHNGIRTPTASYDDASAFISRFISTPVRGNDVELDLLRALIIELGLRSPDASDLPCTLTSARKVLKAEAHVNINEYIATRHKGQAALRGILKPSKSALRKDVRKGNRASLQRVKQQGLQTRACTLDVDVAAIRDLLLANR